MQEFSDRMAVVTGGGSGIGRELVRQLVASGCHIALCDLGYRRHGGDGRAVCKRPARRVCEITTHVCDVSDETAVDGFRRELVEQHQTDHINLLFNNAGVSGGQSFLRDERAHWDRTFAICWGGVYHGCRVFMPMLEASESGHIINISSVNGFWACMAPTMEHTAYSAAKFAVKGFFRIPAGGPEAQRPAHQAVRGNAGAYRHQYRHPLPGGMGRKSPGPGCGGPGRSQAPLVSRGAGGRRPRR